MIKEANSENFFMKRINLKKVIALLPEDVKTTTAGLIDNIVFLQIQLKQLQNEITENGVIDTWNNGKQHCKRASTNVTVYNSLLKSYNVAVKTLLTALKNKEERQEVKSALLQFLEND